MISVLLGALLTALPDTAKEDDPAVLVAALRDARTEVRAAAAERLRHLAATSPDGTLQVPGIDRDKEQWAAWAEQITPGMTKAEVADLLPAFARAADGSGLGTGTGRMHIERHRLDHHWIVTIPYENPDRVLEAPNLERSEMLVWVPPPDGFTGTWTAWYVNGRKGREVRYSAGKYHGPFVAYHDSGSKSYRQHFQKGVVDGPDEGWHRDGSKSYSGRYRDGKQEGTWTHWYPDGTKQSEVSFEAGKYHGRVARWAENGTMRHEQHYRRGVKHGTEAAWDEHGVLLYRREYRDGQLVESR